MSPVAPSIGQRFNFEFLLHKPSTVITIKSINQAWLNIFYFKVIAVNMVIHYKFIRDNAENFSEFFHYQKLPKYHLVSSNVPLRFQFQTEESVKEIRGWFCLLLVMKKF